jgi:hypothetical protein
LNNVNPIFHAHDRGGRRSGIARRRDVIPGYEPERRSGRERRSGQERRSLEQKGEVDYLRRDIDRYAEFSNTHRGVTYGIIFSLPIWAVIIFLIVRQVWS